VRWLVSSRLSGDAFGCFQASGALSAMVTSVFASSVGPSVVPRMSAKRDSVSALSEELNEQTRLYLVLMAPVVLVGLVVPEWIVQVLYSDRFRLVADQLPWQLVGEVFRLPVWMLSSVLFVLGRSRAYFAVEAVALLVSVVGFGGFSLAGGLGPALLGVLASLVPFAQFVVLVWFCFRECVVFERSTWVLVVLVVGVCVVGALAFRVSVLSRIVGGLLALIAAWWAARAVWVARSR
jgi:O-antigen/teichoic acid export membrane protein